MTQETKIYSIISNNLPAFRKQWLPYLTGILLISSGTISMLVTTILMLSYKIFNIDYLDNIFSFYNLDTYFKKMISHFSFFILGYSNLMYLNGISSKTHRYFVYSSYLVIIMFIIAILFGIFDTQ